MRAVKSSNLRNLPRARLPSAAHASRLQCVTTEAANCVIFHPTIIVSTQFYPLQSVLEVFNSNFHNFLSFFFLLEVLSPCPECLLLCFGVFFLVGRGTESV